MQLSTACFKSEGEVEEERGTGSHLWRCQKSNNLHRVHRFKSVGRLVGQANRQAYGLEGRRLKSCSTAKQHKTTQHQAKIR